MSDRRKQEERRKGDRRETVMLSDETITTIQAALLARRAFFHRTIEMLVFADESPPSSISVDALAEWRHNLEEIEAALVELERVRTPTYIDRRSEAG